MLRVAVLYAPAPRDLREVMLDLPAGATVADALAAAGVRVPEGGEVGVWGRPASLAQALREGDRVEVCRPLLVDPKVARRERFRRQGSRAAGLFKRRRPAGKAGD